LFECEEFHSEFEALEVKRHERLTDRFNLHYFELPKLPKIDSADEELNLWLSLFKAETEEELEKIESRGGEIMEQAVSTYRRVSGTREFQELERLRFEAKYNEAAALDAERRRTEIKTEMKTKIEMAKKMLAKGIPVNEIAAISGLTVDEINRL
jgi:predicted transposase/invertase (TIGR01784 family)